MTSRTFGTIIVATLLAVVCQSTVNSQQSTVAPSLPAASSSPAPGSGDASAASSSPAPAASNRSNSPEKGFVSLEGDYVRVTVDNGEPSHAIASGHVVARYEDVVVTSDRAEADYKSGVAVFDRNVVITQGEKVARGSTLKLNLRTGEWSFTEGSTQLLPSMAQGYLLEPFFVKGDRIETLRTKETDVLNADITSCDLTQPHYHLDARSMQIYPGRKAVLRHVSLYALNRKLVTLPVLVIPLHEGPKDSRLIPKVGQSVEEGYFIKAAYPYQGSKAVTGLLLLDLMTKKGVGEGISHSYNFLGSSGKVDLYHIFDKTLNQDTFTGSLSHNQLIGDIKANFNSDFRTYSYVYAPKSRTINNQLRLFRDKPNATTSLSLGLSNNSSVVTTSNLTANLRHQQKFGKTLTLNSSFDYSGYESSFSDSKRLTSQIGFTNTGPKLDWGVTMLKVDNLSSGASSGLYFGGQEKLPELSVTSDSQRLGKFLPFGLPGRVQLFYGRYMEMPSNTERDRTFLYLNSPSQTKALGSSLSLTSGMGLKQYFYSDNTAQYSTEANAELAKKLGRQSVLTLSYRLVKSRGYTPFRFDYLGKYNAAALKLDVKETQKFKLALMSGYDFQQKETPWQDLTLRMTFAPGSSFGLYTATGYDLNRSQWRTLINQLRIRGGEKLKLDFGTRYDTQRGQWAQIRGRLDAQVDDKTRFQAIAGWDGFTKSFDYRSFMITRDLHCWEASLTYVNQGGFYQTQSLMFNLRLKAFPVQNTFGVGQYGQLLDTSVGDVYDVY